MSEGNNEAANNVQHRLGSAHFLPLVEESAVCPPLTRPQVEERKTGAESQFFRWLPFPPRDERP